MRTFDSDRVASSKELRKCFDELKKPFGVKMIDTIVEMEVMFGIIFTGSLNYRLSQIDDALRRLLGDSACEIMMDSIVEYLKD